MQENKETNHWKIEYGVCFDVTSSVISCSNLKGL